MAGGRQLRLLLWKDYLIRKRNFVTLAGIIWAAGIMFTFYIVRENVDNQDFPTCQFPARALPSAGMMPFLQSFICSVSNECSPLDQFEEIPAYEKAKFTQIQRNITPLLNESLLELASSMPDAVKLLATLADVADEPTFRDFSKNGLKVKDLFSNPTRVKRYVTSRLELDDDVAQSLMSSEISFQGLLKGNLNRCRPESLSETLMLNNTEHMNSFVKKLCSLTTEDLQKISMDLLYEISFSKYIKMFGNMYYKLAGDDRITKFGDFLSALLRMTRLQHFLPPEVTSLFFGKQTDFSYLNLNMIQKFIDLFQPTFGDTKEFQSIKEFADIAVIGVQYMDKIFGNPHNNDTTGDITDLVVNVVGPKLDINEGLDKINNVINSAADAIEDINDKDAKIDPFNVLTQVTKLIYKFVPKDDQHDVLFYATLISKLMESAHHVININMHLEEIAYNVTLKNPHAIQVLKDLPQNIVAKAFDALVSAERTQILTSKLNFPGQMFCDLGKLQNFFLITKSEAESIKELLCSDAWKNYVNDLISSFGVFDVKNNINDMASLLIQETLGKDTSSQLYSIEKDFQILRNFTSALVTMEAEERPVYDWKKLLGVDEDSKLMKTVREKMHLGKLMLISVHGAIAKEIVKQNAILQYKITPILLDATTLVTAFNDQLAATPTTVTEGLKSAYGEVITTLLLTALDETKTYKSLSTYCEDIFCHGGENAAMYLQFPDGSDKDRLASALCDGSVTIENGLRNDSLVSRAIMKIKSTTHTLLEEINWTRLISGVQKLYVKLDKDYPYLFEFSTYAMDNVTQRNVQKLFRDAKKQWFSIRNLQKGLHLSVKLGFRLLDIIDRGIFNITNEHWLRLKFVVSSSIGPLTVIDDTVRLVTGLLTNSSYPSDLPPMTVGSLRRIIPNLPQLIVDSVNIMVRDDTDIEPIISLLNAEPVWPCSSASLSDILALGAPAQDAVRALETLLCMDGRLIDEWTVYLDERKAKVNKTLTWNNTVFEPHLFLSFSSTFDALVEDTTAVKDALHYILEDDATTDHIGLKAALDYAVKVFNTTDRNIIMRKFLHKFDKVLNSIATPNTQGNVSVSTVWESYIKCSNGTHVEGNCRDAGRAVWQHSLKMLSVMFENIAIDLTMYFSEVNEPDSGLLPLLGFTKSTALYTLYDKLAEFVSVLLNSYFDYGFMSQIRRASQTQFWDCDAVVSALVPAADSSIQRSDIDRVKPYICPSFIYWLSLPRGDNVLFDLVAKPQYFFYSMPVQNATSSFESAFAKATHLADYVTNITKGNKTDLADELELNNIERKLATFIDNILNFKLHETNPQYRQFSDVSRKQYISNIYLTRVVAIVNKLATAINNITIDELNDDLKPDEVAKLNGDLKIIKNMFKRKSVDAIAIHYDVLTDMFWTNDENYMLIEAIDAMCNNLKTNDRSKTILVDEIRTNLQLCAKNYKYIYGQVQNDIEGDYKDARQSLINLVNVLQIEDGSNVTDLFAFLNDRKQQVNSLKHSIKHSYDMGLPIYLKYLQSNLRSYNVILTFLSGGNWWKDLRDQYSGPYAEEFFGYLEKSFEIAGDFLNNLDGVHLVRLVRDMNLNESSSFCRPNLTLSDYLPDPTRALSHLKTQICSTDMMELFREIPPLLYASQGYESGLAISKDIDYQSLNADISTTTSKLDFIANGPSDPQRPQWVTDEKLDIFRRDVMQLLSKETVTKMVFGVISNVVDAGTLFLNNSQCTPCSLMTTWFKQLNLQLFKKQEYDSLLCHLHTLTADDIHRTLKNDFHWDMFIRELISPRNYTKYELNKSMTEFLALVKGHLLEDISAPTTKLTECLAKNVSSNAFGNVSLFISVLGRTTRLLQVEVPHLQEVDGMKDLPYLNQLYTDVAHNLDVFTPLKGYVKSKVNEALMEVISDDEVVMDIEDADVNLKQALKGTNLEDLLHLHTNDWEHICEDHNCSAIYAIVMSSLNLTKIEEDLPSLQSSEYWQFSFIKVILSHMEGLFSHVARLSGVASTLDVKGAMEGRLEAVLDLVLKILMDDTFDSIIFSLQGLIEELRPLLKRTPLGVDLEAIASGLRIFYQFKTYLVEEEDLKLQVSTLFPDPDAVESGLTAMGINNTNFWSLAAPRIHAGYIQLKPVLSSKDPDYHVSKFVCNLDAMSAVLAPGALDAVTADDVMAATADQFCGLPDARGKELVPVLARQLKFALVMDKVKEHLLTKLYSASDVTAEEGSQVLERFPRLAAMLPSLQDSLGSVMQTLQEDPLFRSLKDFSSVGGLMSSPEFLSDAGTMLCGKPFQAGTSRIIKSIISAPDLTTTPDQAQLDVLPTDFCRSMYQDIISLEGGKIVWSFVKPLIMGRILYTPPHPVVHRIVQKANSSFASMVRMANLVHSFSSAFPSLESISSHREGLEALQHLVTAPGMEALRKMLLGDQDLNLNVDVDGMFERVGDLKGLGGLLSKASQLLRCINLNRFQAIRDEHELMMEAAKLMAVNEFSAGIVFLEPEKLDSALTHVQYKIRMDIESVPTTTRTRPYLWTPGPDSSFIENMRYFRGFVQIQDLLDKAIIQLSTEGSRSKREAIDTDWAVYTQQEPYPCYRKDFFQSSLYESQSMLVAFLFSLLFTVASAVRFIVADKESGNTMLMSVMGVNVSYITVSWVVASLAELTVTAVVVTAILKWGRVLPRADPSLVLVLLIVFGISVLSFCYLMSKLFKSASFAAVCSGILYLITFMPFVVVLSLEAVLNLWLKLVVCLSMSSSLCYAFLYIARSEALGVGTRWAHVWDAPYDDMSIARATGMMIFDAFLYFVIGYIIDRYFGIKSIRGSISNCTSRDEKAGVSIVNVSKVYGAGTRRSKVALDNVSIELHKGQITALLGHNGAGKTTLINILTGMLKPTKGNIIIRSEREGTRLGVCPQKDVLFEYLTAREHLSLYSQLKSGLREEELKGEIDRLEAALSLGSSCGRAARALSGGTRRRLCVALAFCARPTLVVLDEPTAGVDPAARRDIWSLIEKLKEDRTILLTTHHMDEAELLSDQIVIMHKGQIHTTGSPIEIKRTLGSGYRLSVWLPDRLPDDWSYSAEEKAKQLLATVREVVKNATVVDVVNGLVEINLPFYDENGASNDFLRVCSVLEESAASVHRGIAMDCSSLEQVFFDICQRADTTQPEYEEVTSKSASSSSVRSESALVPSEGARRGARGGQLLALLRARYLHYCRNKWLLFMLIVLPSLFVTIAMAFSTVRPPADGEIALKLADDLYSGTEYIVPNPSIYSERIDPTFAQRVMNQLQSDKKSRDWTDQDIPACECKETRQECQYNATSPPPPPRLMVLPDLRTLNTWLVNSHDAYIEKRYGGFTSTIKDNKTYLVAWYNNKGYHALPSYLSALNNAALRAAAGTHRAITAYSHPLKISKEQISRDTLYQHIADAGISSLVLVAFSLVSAGGAIYLVSARARQEKRLQLLCGVSPALYWAAALAWDMMIIIVNTVITAAVMWAFGFPVFVDRNNLPAISLLLVLYGFACGCVVHLTEKLFVEASLANMLLFCANTFLGLAGIVILLILDIISESDATDRARWVLHKVFLLSPQFALGDGMIEIARNTIQAQVLNRFGMDTYRDPLRSSLLALHCAALVAVGVAAGALNLAIEYGHLQWLLDRLVSSKMYAAVGERLTAEPADVAEERRLANQAATEPLPLSVHTIGNINRGFVATEGKNKCVSRTVCAASCIDLGKAYGTRVAVRALSLAVPRGKCTALLGENGAGKSTTFAMLTGETRPTRGRVILAGQPCSPQGLAQGLVSYCPQNNAIDPLLTVRETLELYCQLRGITEQNDVIGRTVETFDLKRYAAVRSGALSGGNKRKLCTAIAFMGRAPLVLLDEPTSGMDPVSRRAVCGGAAGAAGAGRGVVLSTHAPADAARLATRLALLRRGELAAMAGGHRGLARFGGGYEVQCRAVAPARAWAHARARQPRMRLRALHHHTLHLHVPAAYTLDKKEVRTRLSDIFRLMAELQADGDIEDYTLNQSSLEQMFFNDKGTELDGELESTATGADTELLDSITSL